MTMRIYLSFFLLTVSLLSFTQENLQNYTPSILFDEGDWEFKTFQNLYTQSKSFDENGKKVDNANSQYFFTSINQFLYGVNDQINIGFDVWVKSSDLAKDGLDPSYGVTGFGPKVKIAPFKNIPRLSLQSTLLFNLADDPEGNSGERYFLENDATLWLNQLFFDVPINDKSQLFFQQAFWYRFVKDGSFQENNSLQTQTSVFYSYFPTSRLTLYAMSEYFPTHYNSCLLYTSPSPRD